MQFLFSNFFPLQLLFLLLNKPDRGNMENLCCYKIVMKKQTQAEAFIPSFHLFQFLFTWNSLCFVKNGWKKYFTPISNVKGIFRSSNETETALGQSVHAKLGSPVIVLMPAKLWTCCRTCLLLKKSSWPALSTFWKRTLEMLFTACVWNYKNSHIKLSQTRQIFRILQKN